MMVTFDDNGDFDNGYDDSDDGDFDQPGVQPFKTDRLEDSLRNR